MYTPTLCPASSRPPVPPHPPTRRIHAFSLPLPLAQTLYRCWPQDFPHSTHILWRLAESLGATCSLKIQAGRTTHLVVPPVDGQLPLTDKVSTVYVAKAQEVSKVAAKT